MSLFKRGFFLLAALLFLLSAKPGLAEEGEPPPLDPRIRTVAVWDFENATVAGLADITALDYLVRAMPEMIVAKLVSIKDLKLVERVHLREALEELKLGSSELASQKSRLQLGRLSGARFMIFGDFMAIGPTIQVSVRVVEVETSLITFVDSVNGTMDGIGGLINGLSDKVARSFAHTPSATRFGWKEDMSVWKRHEEGIRLIDDRKYKQAEALFKKLLAKHPTFQPAQRQMKMAQLGESYRNGVDALKAKEYNKAISAFKKVLKADAAFQPARDKLKAALKAKRQAR
ncbi:MAG: hypothetical protein HQL52_12190 [Magnetococcales bacterium]|nr:hypothetical protein [Magnetococcales bacterium]